MPVRVHRFISRLWYVVRDGDESAVSEFKRRRRARSAINRIRKEKKQTVSEHTPMPSVKEWRNEKHSEKERREVYMQRVPLRGRVRELRHVAFWNLKRRKEEKIFFSSSYSSQKSKFFSFTHCWQHAEDSCSFRCGALNPCAHLV